VFSARNCGIAITTQCMFQWLLWRIMNTAEGTRERSELGQTEATVPESMDPADDEALEMTTLTRSTTCTATRQTGGRNLEEERFGDSARASDGRVRYTSAMGSPQPRAEPVDASRVNETRLSGGRAMTS
jgi:hypothetical protein